MIDQCHLCNSQAVVFFHQDKNREYWQCQSCQLIQVPKVYQLSSAAEKAEYDKHQNDNADPGYRKFLSRTCKPLFGQLKADAKGLDFGCGPGPTLSLMAAEQGFGCENYDPFYFPQTELLNRQYDFISATEVIEHIGDARRSLNQLTAMLKPGGILALMTKRSQDLAAFKQWHYKNDPTHISFFHLRSFEYIAQHWQLRLQVIDQDVVFLQKGQP